jgi:hypothetical protein
MSSTFCFLAQFVLVGVRERSSLSFLDGFSGPDETHCWEEKMGCENEWLRNAMR